MKQLLILIIFYIMPRNLEDDRANFAKEKLTDQRDLEYCARKSLLELANGVETSSGTYYDEPMAQQNNKRVKTESSDVKFLGCKQLASAQIARQK